MHAFQLTISGIGGERVVPTMRLRLEETLRQAEAQGIRYEVNHEFIGWLNDTQDK